VIQEVFGDVHHFVAAFGYAPRDEMSQLVARASPELAELATLVAARAHLAMAIEACGEATATIDGLLEAQKKP
jgi:hypothetical protein